MSIVDQLNAIKDALGDWARIYKGEVFIGADTGHVLTQIINKPGMVQAYVMLPSEDPYGEHEEAGMVLRTFLVVISRGRGLALDPGTNLLKQVGSQEPLYDIIENARDILRHMEMAVDEDMGHDAMNAEQVLAYRGFRPWRGSGELPIDAMELQFDLINQLT